MSRVITFSRQFPAYHPKAGQPTYFVEKIWKGLWDTEPSMYIPFAEYWQRYDQAFPHSGDVKENIHEHEPKWHTIRAGHRWNVGDRFSPRVWSGKPYNSKQVIIAPDIEIKKVWNFEIADKVTLDGKELSVYDLQEIAKNDGLTFDEMTAWFKFPKPFSGQVLCWNPNLEY